MVQSQTTEHVLNGVGTTTMQSRRRLIPFALLVVLTAGALITAVLSPNSPASASTAVRAALTSTMTASSVSFTLNEDISGTQSANLTVSGSCATGPECRVTLATSGAASTLGTTHLVISNDVAYVEPSSSLAGKLPTPWVSIPFSAVGALQSGIPSDTQGLPAALEQLVNVGDTVTDEGDVTLNGVTVHEYTVSASASIEQQQLSTLMNALPSSATSSLGAISLSGYAVKIYVNTDGTLAELALNTSLSTSKGSESLDDPCAVGLRCTRERVGTSRQ